MSQGDEFELQGGTIVPRLEDGELDPRTDFSGQGQILTGKTWRNLRVELVFTTPTDLTATWSVGGNPLGKQTFAVTQPPAGHVELHAGSMGAFGDFTNTLIDYDDVKFVDN